MLNLLSDNQIGSNCFILRTIKIGCGKICHYMIYLHKKGEIVMNIALFNNLFRQLSMKDVKGYDNLPNRKKELFDKVYNLHLSSMDERKRRMHTDEHIHKVEWDFLNDCLRVTFKNGNIYKYWKNETWDQIK